MKPRFMSQEFKDQNALLVDGRLLCRHFLYGRCIKAGCITADYLTLPESLFSDCKNEKCAFFPFWDTG